MRISSGVCHKPAAAVTLPRVRPAEVAIEPRISVVVPVRDELANLEPLHRELCAALAAERAVEFLYVDDASRDGSGERLDDLAKLDRRVRVLHLAGHQGQSAALDAGFRAARGAVTITLDADLQNDPADLPRLLEALEGADAVAGVRVGRPDPASRRLASRAANRFRRWLLPEAGMDEGCTLRVVRTPWLRRIRPFRGMHRFLPSLLRLEGARVVELPVSYRRRQHGSSKYGIAGRSVVGFVDALAVRWMYARRLRYGLRESTPDGD